MDSTQQSTSIIYDSNMVLVGADENLLVLSPSSASYEQYKWDTSSPIGKSDHSENYHPSQWAERAQTIQLSSSPDRILYSHANSPSSSSPMRSSPILFSPPPATRILRESNYQTPKMSSVQNRRGRPKLDQISELILTGTTSKSSIKCEVCHRVFPRDKSLQAHMRTHTGERPYKCTHPGCDRAFAQSGQLRTHIRLHTGEKPFVCRETGCGALFTHPNRRCATHPKAGVRRIIPVLSVKKENRITKSTTANNNNTPAKKVLANITSIVNNSPVKCAVNSKGLPIARKSVINHVGRASRKLDAELSATVSMSESNYNRIECKQYNSRNNMDILGAIALMELAGVYPIKVGQPDSINKKDTKEAIL